MKISHAVAALIVTAGIPAKAQTTMPWKAMEANGQCNYLKIFPDTGLTTVGFQPNAALDGKVFVVITNRNWSVAAGDQVIGPLIIQTAAVSAEGVPLAGPHLIGAAMPADMLARFVEADPRIVEFRLGSKLLTRLDFTGFKAGWTAFAACMDKRPATDITQKPLAKEHDMQDAPIAAKSLGN